MKDNAPRYGWTKRDYRAVAKLSRKGYVAFDPKRGNYFPVDE